jgi:hypothetical protein
MAVGGLYLLPGGILEVDKGIISYRGYGEESEDPSRNGTSRFR